ncbi:hypothetical protein CLHOM_27530 [Clostridium homopropionicum DSM 5847]|uniref:Uncharacterized protein n=1 Tax=Clostridium homopropionicum DSM 5847 TaxID=1121318 RepID=A0A0L6Z783_9CLOT|nr:hypothetical protein [Clostridium homopropionicum]KOA18814.1 hypothetical protein CLHOM_27530 [Clostridium homopropionicum DSM 5847]SFG89403.1 hypothetical protein SAMN04488501_1221 [Clostridium homopropionicum]
MKKVFKTICMIFISIIFVFNLSKVPTYLEFKSYLKTNYPAKDFNVSWIKYNFIYGGSFSKVVCTADNTTFQINKGKTYISDNYYLTKNTNAMNKILRENLYSENEELNSLVRSVYGSSNSLNHDQVKDYKQIVDSIGISFYSDKIINKRHIAQLIHEVIEVYKRNNIKFNQISTDFEMDGHVYSIVLKDEQLGYDVNAIVSSIRNIK